MESKSNPKLLTYWLAFGLEMIKQKKMQMFTIKNKWYISCFPSAQAVLLQQNMYVLHSEPWNCFVLQFIPPFISLLPTPLLSCSYIDFIHANWAVDLILVGLSILSSLLSLYTHILTPLEVLTYFTQLNNKYSELTASSGNVAFQMSYNEKSCNSIVLLTYTKSRAEKLTARSFFSFCFPSTFIYPLKMAAYKEKRREMKRRKQELDEINNC